MNIKNKVRSAKCGVLGALVAVGLSAFAADPSVTVGEVTAGEPWSTITVNYTLGGVDAATDYKVAFDITAGGQTASVTNDATKLTDGAATKEINTVEIFGKEVVDTKAKVKVSLIAVKAKETPAGQLWEGGPIWAETNLGDAEQGVPAEYGAHYTFDNATNEVAKLGDGWRLPTRSEFEALISNCGKGEWTNQNGVNGRLFKGTGDYASKSIFLPAAGYNTGSGRKEAGARGDYWSSTEKNATYTYSLYFKEDDASVAVNSFGRVNGVSVLVVRDAK